MDAQQSHCLSILLTAASIGTAAGVIGAVYVLVLTTPGNILGWWKRWITNTIHALFAKIYKDEMKAYDNAEYWLKPIVSCELCVSGQIALWSSIITQQFNLLGLIFCICQSILTAWAIARKMK